MGEKGHIGPHKLLEIARNLRVASLSDKRHLAECERCSPRFAGITLRLAAWEDSYIWDENSLEPVPESVMQKMEEAVGQWMRGDENMVNIPADAPEKLDLQAEDFRQPQEPIIIRFGRKLNQLGREVLGIVEVIGAQLLTPVLQPSWVETSSVRTSQPTESQRQDIFVERVSIGNIIMEMVTQERGEQEVDIILKFAIKEDASENPIQNCLVRWESDDELQDEVETDENGMVEFYDLERKIHIFTLCQQEEAKTKITIEL